MIDPGKTSERGNAVSPGVLATNHQHPFCLRIEINTVIQEDSITVPQTEHENPHGNAWRLVKTRFETSGFANADTLANRCFKIVNESVRNPISGNPVGYKPVPLPCQLLLAGPDSVVRRRARFAEHHIWVSIATATSGSARNGRTSHCPRSMGCTTMRRGRSVRNQDIVLWHTFGMTHNSRVEDFPVMPVEIMTLSLKSEDFLEKNPALDVPHSRQSENKSVLVQDPLPSVAKVTEPSEGACCGKSKL